MDWNILSKSDTSALLLVAHPDDETIFCGGTMLYYPKCKWQVVCMTEGEGNAAYEEFEKKLKEFDLDKDYGCFVRGGHWRGFLAKYPEANLMHKKMLAVSLR